MRIWYTALITSLALLLFSGTGPEACAQLNTDSLRKVIQQAKHDTTRIKVYLYWDEQIYLQDTQLDIELNEKISAICERNLKKGGLSTTEGRYFKSSCCIAHNNIGLALNNQNLFPEAIENFRKALGFATDVKDENLVSMLYNNLGISYRGLRKFKEALRYYELCLNSQKNTSDTVFRADTYNNLGLIYADLGDNEKAMAYYRSSIALRDSTGKDKGLADTYHNMGVVLSRQGKFVEAIRLLQKSAAVFNTLKYYQGESNSYIESGNVLIDKKDYEPALRECKKGFVLASQHEILPSVREACECLYIVYKAKGQTDQALHYYERYIHINDSLSNEEQKLLLERQEARHEYKIREERLKQQQVKKNLLARAESRKQRIIIYTVSGGFLVVLILIFVILRNLRENKRKNRIISEQKVLVETKQQEIVDSINYARRLQDAILPSADTLQQMFPEHFMLYLPKDIVAGDFYWMETSGYGSGNQVFFAVADCTGHGVPGALVSVVCSNAMQRAVQEFKLTDPGRILDKVRDLVLETFEASGNNVNDGMDISLASLELRMKNDELKMGGEGSEMTTTVELEMKNEELKMDDKESAITSTSGHKPVLPPDTYQTSNNKPQTHPLESSIKQEELKAGDAQLATRNSQPATVLRWSGANNPLWILRRDEDQMEEIKADKQPVGRFDNPHPFNTHTVNLHPGDTIYLFSDGFPDQFGGDKGKKMKALHMKKLLVSIRHKPMHEQGEYMRQAFEKWKGELEQVDDVCMAGIRF